MMSKAGTAMARRRRRVVADCVRAGLALSLALTISACTVGPNGGSLPTATAVPAVWPAAIPPLAPGASVTETFGAYTIGLHPLYADASRAVITYTVAGPPDPWPASTWLGQSWQDTWMFLGPAAQQAGQEPDLSTSNR